MEYWHIINRRIKCLGLFAGIFLISPASAQTISSYSGLGMGDIIRPAFANHIGNGLGLSRGEGAFVNQMNPALLPYNVVTTFQTGLGFETKTVSRNDLNDNYSSFNLQYIGTAIPAKAGRWSFALGIQPYSRVFYNFSSENEIGGIGNTALITNEGSGGFNQAYFSNGFEIWNNLTVGVKLSYVFSSIIKESTTIITDSLDPARSSRTIYQRTNANDILFSTGIAYKHQINDDVTVNYGITFDPETKISSERFERVDVATSNGTILDVDTLANGLNGSYRLPQRWGAGISFNKGFDWSVGAEFEYQQWDRFKDFSNRNDNFRDSFSFRIGGDVVPNSQSVENYLNRITYRLGFSFEQLPYFISGENIREYGVNFGWSLPVSRISYIDFGMRYADWSLPVSRISYIDFGMRYAVRGTTDNNLVRENYFLLHLGFTFNDRWFIRSAFD